MDHRQPPRAQADPRDVPTRIDVESVLDEARVLVRAGDPESALSLLEAAMDHEPGHLELQGFAGLVRNQLLRYYRDMLGDGRGVARRVLDDAQLLRFNLPPEAGFLLSQMDGTTSVADLLAVCGLDGFRAFRLLGRLVEAGIVEIDK